MNKPLLGIVAAATTGALLLAQDAPQPGATFRSEINYVQIPVRVLDARGEFVSGLAQSDFQIFEDGQPQTITAFSAVDIPFIRSDGAAADRPWAAGEAVASNEPLQVDGRVYVFLLDNQSMPAAVALRTRHVMRRFIRDGLAANDMAAIVLTGSGRGQAFTRNPWLLNEAIDRLMSDADPTVNSVDRIMQTIADTAQWMGAIKGRRKALVLITPSSICSLVNLDLNVFSNCNESARYALRMALQSDVSIYTIDPRGAVPTQGAPAEVANPYGESGRVRSGSSMVRGPLDAARYIAEESGGFAIVNSNSLDAGFARVMRENSSYYLLGYYSTNNRADGKLRKNVIAVSRRTLRVVHRAAYLAPREKGDSRIRTTRVANSPDDQLQELANNPLPVSTMSLRVAAAPFQSSDGRSSVSVVVEIPAGTLDRTDDVSQSASRVRLSIGFYKGDGESVGGEDPTIDVSRVPGETFRYVSSIPVPPGVYRLWVGAVETRSRGSGSVMTDIEVPDFNRPMLSLSGITVSIGEAALAGRDFSANDELSLCGELYDRRRRNGPVVATVTVSSDAGRAVYQTPFAPARPPFGHCARIPLTQFSAGSYVATVEAVSATPKRVSVARTIAFRLR